MGWGLDVAETFLDKVSDLVSDYLLFFYDQLPNLILCLKMFQQHLTPNQKKICYKLYWGLDVAETFLDKVSDLVADHKKIIDKQRYARACLTDEQERQFQKTKKCMFCNI